MGGITFRAQLAEAVMDGRKVVTRRIPNDNPNSPWWRESCGFKLGRHYAIQPGRGQAQVGRAFVVGVHLGLLGDVSDAEARREGCVDREDFKRLWIELNGDFDGSLKVWVLELERRLRFRFYAPAGSTRIVNTFPAADVAELQRLLGEHSNGWAIDNRTGVRVPREVLVA